jgi:bacillolysin
MKKKYISSLFLFCLILIFSQSNAQKVTSAFSKKEKNPFAPTFQLPAKTVEGKNSETPGAHKHLLFSGSKDSLKSLRIYKSEKGLPIYIKGGLNKKYPNLSSDEQIKSACHSHLKTMSSLLGIKDPAAEFEIYSIVKENKQKHVRMNQKYLGIPVYGSEIILHFNGDSVELFNGRHYPTPLIKDVKPVLTSSVAIHKAVDDLGTLTTYRQLTSDEKKFLNYEAPASELVLYQAHEKQSLELTWHVTIRPNLLDNWEYFINAKTGEVIYKANLTCATGPATTTATDLNGVSQNLNTYLQGSTYYMVDASKPMFNIGQSPNMPDNPVGAIWTLDAQNTDLVSLNQISSLNNTWTDPSAVSAHYQAGLSYNYYKSTFNRNSLDSLGGTIKSVVNVTQGGASMENAYWNGAFMAYGNGGTLFKPLAGGLDVTAHELTHGVISKTANLQYSFQSGAINESMADIFGCMVDRNDWQIGEDIVQPASFPSGALRDLSDPHNGSTPGDFKWQPRNMSEFVNTTNDHGGVHVNSGIPNYAFYLFATSPSVDKSIAENVYYRALTTYLVKTSQFIDLRLAVIQSADDLYPAGSLVSNAARAAFDSVQIFDGPPTPPPSSLPVNPGPEYVLFESSGPDAYSLYIYDFANPTNPYGISSTPVSQKPSITDDGTMAYFVSKDHKIRRINLNPLSPNETVVDARPIWDNVAVSKDGSKLAATTIASDSAIFIYNFSSWTKFHLYNPTYSSGITTDGPIYADGLDWDHTGEYVIYDCFNDVPADSSDISYWDIGIIKVWDNVNNGPGNGNIEKLFSQLPANVDIGNPTFSKNSPDVIAFDYIDYSVGYSVLACNTQTLEVNEIWQNNTLGYPNFSKMDDELVFTSVYAAGDTVIAFVDLGPDKISPASSANILEYFSRMPVVYAKGTRPTGTTMPNQVVPKINVFPNPFEDQIFINCELLKSEYVDISVYNTLGQPVKKLFSGTMNTGLNKHTFSLQELSPGSYFIKILTGSDFQTFKIVKL